MPVLASAEFKRIIFEEWTYVIVIASLVVVGSVFLISTIWVLLLPKDKRERIANLPLEDEPPDPAPTHHPTSAPPKKP